MAPQAGCSRTRRRDKRRERCQGACAPRRPPGPVAVYEHARGPGQSLRSLSGASRVRHARGGEKRRSFRLFSVLGTYRYRAGVPVGPPPAPRFALARHVCAAERCLLLTYLLARFHWKLWSPLHPRSPVPGPRARAAGASWRVVGSSRLRCGTRRHSRRSGALCARGGRRRRVSRTAGLCGRGLLRRPPAGRCRA